MAARLCGIIARTTRNAAGASRRPRRTGERQQQALGQELAHDTRPRGTEDFSQSDLAAPNGTVGEQQIRDVGTRDDHQEGRGSEQDQQRSPSVAEQLAMEWHGGAHAPYLADDAIQVVVPLTPRWLGDLLPPREHLRGRRFGRYARPDSRNHV